MSRSALGCVFALAANVLAQPAARVAKAAPIESISPEATSVPTVSKMTLREALEYAQTHQPALRAARERFLAVAAEARIAAAQWKPSVGAAAEVVAGTANNSTSVVLAPDTVDLPRIGGTPVRSRAEWQPYATTVAALGMQQEIFDFGRIAAETAAGEALVAIERDRLELTQVDIRLITTQSYFAVKAAHAVLDAATQAQQRAQVHSDFADAAVASGLRPPIERTRAAADLTRFIVGRIRAEGNLRVARSVFAAAVGYPEVELDSSETTEQVPPIPPLAQVEQRTLALQPEVLEAHDRRMAQQRRTVALRAKMRPNLFASASISGRAGGAAASNGVLTESRGLLPQVPNYDVGLVLSWPLYEPTVDAAVSASKQREWEYQAAIAAAEQRARTSAQQAYRRTRVAQSALSALSRAAEAARANYAQAEARFKAGLGTSIELADAEAIRLEAEVQEAVGGFEFATARAQLERVMGG